MALDFLCMAFLASAIGRCDGFFAEINGRDHFSRRMMQIALYFTSDVAGTTLPLTESHSAGKEDRERERERERFYTTEEVEGWLSVNRSESPLSLSTADLCLIRERGTRNRTRRREH